MANASTYGGPTILSNPIFVETILPFILVFTIVFAILQKSKILGDGKKQIDAIVSLVIGLLVISFGQVTGIILQLIPFLAVSLVIILVLMLLLGSFTEQGKFFEKFPKGIKYILIVGVTLAVAIAVIYITGFWETVNEWLFVTGGTSGLLANIIFIIIVVGAIIAVIVPKGNNRSSSDK